jgi:hypothetical protein
MPESPFSAFVRAARCRYGLLTEPRDMALDLRQPRGRDEITPLRHHPLRLVPPKLRRSEGGRRRSLSSLFDEGAGHKCVS